MLILSRRCGEKIIIGNREVEMIVISFDKGQVKLGFEADRRIKVNREEVYIKMENEQQLVDVPPKIELEDTSIGKAANDAGKPSALKKLDDE